MFARMLDCRECAFYRSCCQTVKECREHGGGKVDREHIPSSRRVRAEHVLLEYGIARKDIAPLLQELGYTLLNTDLYSDD